MDARRNRGNSLVKLYVEGGGDSNLLKTACRKGFSSFLRSAGLGGSMPRIVACGSRKNAYDSFCRAINHGENALLLVDSESPVSATHQQGPVAQWEPWGHLRNRQGDQWTKPANASDEDCHLMVQCMEAWLLTDGAVLREFFGQGFNANALPATANQIESIPKNQLYRALADATRGCKTKAIYGKSEHSFKLLALISPVLVAAASPWAKRFIDTAKARA